MSKVSERYSFRYSDFCKLRSTVLALQLLIVSISITGTLQQFALAGADLSLAPYENVTDKRLRNPEAENWLQWRGNYEGWTYSPLEQINSENVSDLQVAWVYSTGVKGGHESPPVVNNGYMYVTTPEHQVIALNARTGYELWRFKRELPKDHFAMHRTNRGVALYRDKVFFSGLDTCAIALDAVTGEQAWENCLADWRQGFHMTIAPLAAEGLVIFGVSGAEYGIRCFLVALDAAGIVAHVSAHFQVFAH